ncbi:hypothetical protein GYB57_04885 [bacterium]|nr:hypothetical protein [bacterium]
MKKRIVGIIFLILVGALFVSIPFLKQLLSEKIEQKLGSNFYYSYEDISVSLLHRKIEFSSLKFAYPKDSSNIQYVGEAASFSVEGFDFMALIYSQSLDLGKIELIQPSLKTRLKQEVNQREKTDTLNLEQLNFYSFIEGGLNQLKLGELNVQNGHFDWFYGSQDSVWRMIDGIDLKIKDFTLDSTVAAENNGWFILDDFTLNVNHLMEKLPDSIHVFTADSVKMSYKDSSISMANVRMMPRFDRNELPGVLPHQQDVFTLKVSQLALNYINIDHLIYKKQLFVGEVGIDGFDLNVYRDKSLPFPHIYKPLPIPELLKLEFEMTLDSVLIRNGQVAYEQQNVGAPETGIIVFDQIDATLYNLTSSEEQVDKYAHTVLNTTALLQGGGKIDLNVDFDLLDTNGGHRLIGSIADFNLSDLNQIILPLTHVKVKEGKSSQTSFNFYASTFGTEGEIEFRYDGLKVSLLDKDEYELRNEKRKWLGSLFLNTLVVRESNPKGNTLRIGTIQSERNTEKSIFNLWWEGIASGMGSTMINFKKDAKEVKIQ